MHNDYFIDFFPACWNSRNIVNEARKRIDPNASPLDLMREVAINAFDTPQLRPSKPIPADSTFYTKRNIQVDAIKKQVADRIMSLFPKMKSSALSGFLRYSLTNGWKLRLVDKEIPGTKQTIKVWMGTKQFNTRDLNRIQEFTDALAEFKRTGIVTGRMSKNTLSDNVKMNVIERGEDWNEFVENELEKQIEIALNVLIRKGNITEASKEQFKKASPETQLKTLKAWDATPKILNIHFNNVTAKQFIEADEAKAEEILKDWVRITQPNEGTSMFAYTWLTNPELAQELVENAFKVNAERKAARIQAARWGNRDNISDAEYEKAIEGTVDDDLKFGKYERAVNISGGLNDEDKELFKKIMNTLHDRDDIDNTRDLSSEELEAKKAKDEERRKQLYGDWNVNDTEDWSNVNWDEDEDEEYSVMDPYYADGMEEYIDDLLISEDDDYIIAKDALEYFDIRPTSKAVNAVARLVKARRQKYRREYDDPYNNYDEEINRFDDDDDDFTYTNDYINQYNYDDGSDSLINRFLSIHKESFKPNKNEHKKPERLPEPDTYVPEHMKGAFKLANHIANLGYFNMSDEQKEKINKQWEWDVNDYGFPKGVPQMMDQYAFFVGNKLHTTENPTTISYKKYQPKPSTKSIENYNKSKRLITADEILSNPRVYRDHIDEYGNAIPFYTDVYKTDTSTQLKNVSPDSFKSDNIFKNCPKNIDDICNKTYTITNEKAISYVLRLISTRHDDYRQEFTYLEPIEGDDVGEISDSPFRCNEVKFNNNRGAYRFYQTKKVMRPDEQIDGSVEFLRSRAIDHDAYNFDISPNEIASIYIRRGYMEIIAKYPVSQRRIEL